MFFAQTVTANFSHFTCNGGADKSITVNRINAEGLSQDQILLPEIAQGVLISIFSTYSAIRIFSIITLHEAILTDFSMSGRIIKIGETYNLELKITGNTDRIVVAAFSENTTLEELNNHTAFRRAALFLLQQMGVSLTENTRQKLTAAATETHIQAQTFNARGVVAERRGNEAEALANFNAAAIFDPTMTEAQSRLSVLEAKVRSGNIGEGVRNNMAWRRDWVVRLTETEQFFAALLQKESMPYALFFDAENITQGQINWQNETVNLNIQTHLHGSCIWTLSIERALQTVFDGLRATGKAQEWGLQGWPRQGVTNLNVFGRRTSNFNVVFELLNAQNRVIGTQTLQTSGFWELNWTDRPSINVNASNRQTMSFQNVNANHISGQMSIRVGTVNGIPAETAARDGLLQIRPVGGDFFAVNDMFRFSRGVLLGFSNTFLARIRSSSQGIDLLIPDQIWGDAVIAVGDRAFKNIAIRYLRIPDNVRSIGDEAFFMDENFLGKIRHITIGSSVQMNINAFNVWGFNEKNSFVRFYNAEGRRGGEYFFRNRRAVWSHGSIEVLAEKERRSQRTTLTFGIIALLGLFIFGFAYTPPEK